MENRRAQQVMRRNVTTKSVERLCSILTGMELSDRHVRFDAARRLHLIGGRNVLCVLLKLCESRSSVDRELGAFGLGQLGTPRKPFARESEPVLRRLARSDRNRNVRSAAISALGHLQRASSVPTLLECVHDRCATCRASVAFALSRFSGKRVTRAVLLLSIDADSEVRSWVAFALRMRSRGSVAVRRRLAQMVDDDAEDVREEAAIGLSLI